MPQRRDVARRGPVAVRALSVRPELQFECPRCKAAPGNACFNMRSWVPDLAHEGGGFYGTRMVSPHAERKPVAAPAAPVSTRGELRKAIRSIIMRKLSGSQRPAVRAWAESTRRTEAELAAKLAELEAMGDLS